jgi:hypothetical protein
MPTRARFIRCKDPIYHTSRQGPHITTDEDPNEIRHYVHKDEMPADIAAACADEITQFAQIHHARHRHPTGVPQPLDVVVTLKPRHQIPGGKLAHLDYHNGKVTLTCDEAKMPRPLAEQLSVLCKELGKHHHYAETANA